MKCYVQNGFNKRVFEAPNFDTAVRKLLKSLLIKRADGSELADLCPLTLASNYGFFSDMVLLNQTDKIDEIKAFDTAAAFSKMGRKDIAKWLREHAKKDENVSRLMKGF